MPTDEEMRDLAGAQDRTVQAWMVECKTDDVEEALIAKGRPPVIYYDVDKLPKKSFYIAPYRQNGKETFLFVDLRTIEFILLKTGDDKKKK